ncbi:MAG: hypothetical protein GY754_31335 [bacterium]|nr:hypothetical protein [bacterium]
MKALCKKFAILIVVLATGYHFGFQTIEASQAVLNNIKLTTSHDKTISIPEFGKKAIVLIYSDYDARDFNEPLSQISKKHKSIDSYKGIGVVNLKDNPTILPNWLVKAVVRSKEKKNKTQLLFDESYKLKNKWGLGNCNNKSVIIIIGKDKRLKYLKKISSQQQSRAEIPRIREILTREK